MVKRIRDAGAPLFNNILKPSPNALPIGSMSASQCSSRTTARTLTCLMFTNNCSKELCALWQAPSRYSPSTRPVITCSGEAFSSHPDRSRNKPTSGETWRSDEARLFGIWSMSPMRLDPLLVAPVPVRYGHERCRFPKRCRTLLFTSIHCVVATPLVKRTQGDACIDSWRFINPFSAGSITFDPYGITLLRLPNEVRHSFTQAYSHSLQKPYAAI